MAEDDLVQRLNPANDNVPTDEGGLEKEVKKSFSETIKDFSLWDWTKIAAVNVAGAALGGGLLGFGAINAAATTFSYVGAKYFIDRKEGFEKSDVQSEFLLGGTVTPILNYLVNFIDRFSNPLAYWGAYTAVLLPFISLTHGLHNIFKKYSPLSFIKKLVTPEPYEDTAKIVTGVFEKETVKETFKVSGIFGLPLLAMHYFLPTAYIIPGLVPLRMGYRYITAKTEKRKAQAASKHSPMGPASTPGIPQPANDNYPRQPLRQTG